jgi:hypothetical protein
MRNRKKNKRNKIEYSSRVQIKKNKNSSSHGASAWAHLGRRCWAHQPGLPQHRGWVAHLGGGASGLWAAALCASGRIGVGREISFSGGGACFCSCGRLRDLLLRWSHDGLAESRWPRDLLLRRWSGHSRAYGERR